MRRLALVVVAGMSLCATIASAGDAEVFDFNKEIAKATPQAGAANANETSFLQQFGNAAASTIAHAGFESADHLVHDHGH